MFKPALMISNLVSKDKVCLQTISMISKDIDDININYFKDDEFCFIQKRKTLVCFSDMSLNTIIEEPEDLVEDLAMARKSDFRKRQADKARMERIMEPVLSKFHRDKVYNERRKIEIDVVNKCLVNIVRK